jgi:Fis family transcriptional regulator
MVLYAIVILEAMMITSFENMTLKQELPLQDYVREVINLYYREMSRNNDVPSVMYAKIMEEVEHQLILSTMKFTEFNQSKAAEILNLNRGTFRKKLAHYGIE